MIIRIKQVDVFTTTPFGGNPAAVVTHAEGLGREEMQKIAREMNLSETTFVTSSDRADYRIRYFTPRSELDLAGHPTIGTVHVLLEEGWFAGRGSRFRVTQETNAGILPVEVDTTGPVPLITMTLARPQLEPLDLPVDEVVQMLGTKPAALLPGVPVARVYTGIWWMIVALRDLAALSSLEPDMLRIAAASRQLGVIGVTVFCPGAEHSDCSVRVRSFAPGEGVPEDPVCGSGNGCVGAYLFLTGNTHLAGGHAYVAEQGIEVGRPGRVHVQLSRDENGDLVRIGGHAVTVMDGQLFF